MKFRKVPLGKDGWPIEMPIPLPKHWCTSVFRTNDGKQGCLVGWGRYVFSGGKDPENVGDAVMGSARWQFIGRVMDILKLSSYTAGAFDDAWHSMKIDGEKCTTAWEQAAVEFGYTEDV